MQNSVPENSTQNMQQSFVEIVKTLVIALLIVIPVRTFIAQPFIVSGSSMDPTFEDGDYLIVDEISYRFEEPKRLDVVIFRYPKQPNKFFIKRIIGMPGESIFINEGEISIRKTDGTTRVLVEPYIEYPKQDQYSVTLEDDEYFVMGDNRAESSDSRHWGPLPENLIAGKALVRLFPLNNFDVMPGSFVSTY